MGGECEEGCRVLQRGVYMVVERWEGLWVLV